MNPETDKEGLAEIFGLGPARTPGHGVFKDVEELKPGCYLTYEPSGVAVNRYWHLESRPHSESLAETTARVRMLLEDTVKRQLVADVPVCTLLSGALDSSCITAFAADKVPNLDTYSIGYEGDDRYFKSDEFQPNGDSAFV